MGGTRARHCCNATCMHRVRLQVWLLSGVGLGKLALPSLGFIAQCGVAMETASVAVQPRWLSVVCECFKQVMRTTGGSRNARTVIRFLPNLSEEKC